jgi:hypothetical protein
MPLTPTQMDQFLDAHFQYEANDDLDGVLSTLADDANHDIVGWPGGPTYGREAAREFYQALYSDLADGKVESRWRAYGERFMVDESLWTGTAPGRPFGLEGRGRPLEFRLFHVIEFSDEGKIEREQVWVDLAAIQQQLPQD